MKKDDCKCFEEMKEINIFVEEIQTPFGITPSMFTKITTQFKDYLDERFRVYLNCGIFKFCFYLTIKIQFLIK